MQTNKTFFLCFINQDSINCIAHDFFEYYGQSLKTTIKFSTQFARQIF